MAYLTPSPKMQFFTANGVPLVGGKLYTYQAGTTTPLATYVDQAGSSSNPNPVIMDSRGEANVWLANSVLYDFVLKDSTDALIWTGTNVGSAGSTPLASTFKVQNFSGDGTTVAFVLTYEPPNENNTQIYINGAYQQKNTYSLAASTITFSSAPPLGTNNIEVMTIATLSFGYIDSSLVNYIPAGTGAMQMSVQDKLHEEKSILDFYANGLSGVRVDSTGVVDSTLGIQAALNSFSATGGVLLAPVGTFKCNTAQLVVPPNVYIRGAGRMATIFTTTLTVPLFSITCTTAEQFNFGMQDLQIQAKHHVTINPGTFNASIPMVMPRFVRVFFKGTYTGTGDALFQTANVRDTSNNSVSSLSGANIDVGKTYTDVASFGVGVLAQVMVDAKFEQCEWFQCGVGASLIGCDINTFDTCRFHANGWHYYEARSTTWGSQNKLVNCDILQNYRAGGVVFNGTKFSRVVDNYFECQGAWGCYFWADATEGWRLTLNRFDDSNFYSTAPAFGIVNAPYTNNFIEQNDYQIYSFSESPNAVIRNAGYTLQDSNHPQLLVWQNNGEYFPRLSAVIPGHTVGPVNPRLYDPSNIPRTIAGNITPISVYDNTGGANGMSFYNAAASFPTVRFDLSDATQLSYSLQTSARAASGTTIFFTITHCDSTGTARATLVNAAIAGFTTGGYATVLQTLTLNPNLLAQGDCIQVTWQSNTAYIRGLKLI